MGEVAVPEFAVGERVRGVRLCSRSWTWEPTGAVGVVTGVIPAPEDATGLTVPSVVEVLWEGTQWALLEWDYELEREAAYRAE